MSKKKVLIAINCMNIGGAPSVVLAHLRALDRASTEPWLMTLYPSKPANFLHEATEVIGKQNMLSFTLRKRSVFDIQTVWRMYKALRREHFDVVITHLFLANLLIRTLAILSGVPRIISFEHSRYDKKHWWQKVCDRILALWTYRIIVAHEEIASFTAQQEHIAREKFVVIPNPVSLPMKADEAALRTAWGVPANRFLFVSVGRFSEEKGHEYLIRAAALAKKKSQDFFVAIVGHGACLEELRALVTSLNVENVCAVIEDGERARQAYHMAQVFVLPSLREGESIAIREALLAGLPVIASDLPTLRSLVRGTGILVEPGNQEVLADALLSMMTDHEFREDCVQAARERSGAFSGSESIAALELLLV